jgi:hypothetical protein
MKRIERTRVIAKTMILILTLAATITTVAWLGTPRAISNSANFKQQVIPVGKGPGFIAIADVYHDGRLDLLVARRHRQLGHRSDIADAQRR